MIVDARPTTRIRPGTADDLGAIGRLFSPPKPPALLRWLLGDSFRGLQSFVAVVNDEIVGHIGYTISRFAHGSTQQTGVYPILWKVREGAPGGVGLHLLTRVLPVGDFSFIMGGSTAAQKLYRVFGYRMLFEVPTYQKVVNLRGLGPDLLSRRAARALKMRLSALSRTIRASGDNDEAVRLELVPNDTDVESPRGSSQILQNLTSPEKVRWALACPEVDAYQLMVTVEGSSLGTVICYVRPSWSGLLGSVVHIPHLGSQRGLWSATVRQIERFLVARGCSRITVMASDPTFADALVECGFAADRILPFWFRGRNEPPPSWHLTLLEGDLGYRK